MRLISPLISGILRVLKKLLKYFNSTTILAAFAPSFPVEPVISCFYLNETLLPVKLSRPPASGKPGLSV